MWIRWSGSVTVPHQLHQPLVYQAQDQLYTGHSVWLEYWHKTCMLSLSSVFLTYGSNCILCRIFNRIMTRFPPPTPPP